MYAAIWEYQVKKHCLAEFEKIYGRDGTWAQLFKRGNGYIGTELHRDIEKERRYFTIDYWISKTAYETFCKEFSAAYAELDKKCDALTEQEIQHGNFQCQGQFS